MTVDAGVAPPIVTVDGPAGSGKSTLGRRLAATLHLPIIDTGLFYRGVMVAAVRAGVDASDPDALAGIARTARIDVDTDPLADPSSSSLRVDGVDAGKLARDPRRATLLSEISAVPGVRAAVLEAQRRLARGGAVAVGRDCGTVVFPRAAVKFYLWASADVRAHRRAAQLAERGVDVDERAILDEIAGRDALDTTREVSPLRPAPDAHMIDTGRWGAEETVRHALDICRAAGILGSEER